MEENVVTAFVKTKRGIQVYQQCVACKHSMIDEKGNRICQLIDQEVLCNFGCQNWEMRECLNRIGDDQGRIKRPQYIRFLTEIRLRENEAIIHGEMLADDAMSVAEIRTQFTAQTGESPYWDGF